MSGTLRTFWAQALASRLFPLSIEKGTKQPIGLWVENIHPTPEPHPEASAIGVRCLPQDGVSAIDVDCTCNASAGYRTALLRELGTVPVRVGSPPKFLVPFRCDGAVAGRSLPLPCGCKVQVISGQFIAYGEHPDTKRPYEWTHFEAPWPVLNQISLYGLLSYIGVNATGEPRDYITEVDLQGDAPANESELASVRDFAKWRLAQLVDELRNRTEGRGTAIFSATTSITPAIAWGAVTTDDVLAAIETAGHSPNDKRGGRTLGEEVARAVDAGVLVSNPLVKRLHDYRNFMKQALGNGLTEGANTFDVLDGQTFAPMRFTVEEILPEGFILFTSKPKVGKSYVMMDLALSVLEAEKFWGCQCTPGSVLMYAFEDTDRRLQSRYRALRPEGAGNKNKLLYFTGDSNVPRVASVPGEPCFTQHLERELIKRPDTRLVVIDPIIAIRADQKDKTKGLYQVDYDNIKAVQKIAAKYRVSIIGVHHSNKKSDVIDPADMVSGSTGMTAAADGVWILEPDRERENAQLYMQMRDTGSPSFALVSRKINGGIKWDVAEGGALAQVTGDIERRIMVAAMAGGCEATIKDLIKRCPDVNESTLRVYVRRMSQPERHLLENTVRGHYITTGAQPVSRPEGARNVIVNAAKGGGYAEFQRGDVVDIREVLASLRNSDKAPVHDGFAVSLDAAHALLAAFADPDKLIKDMESRHLAFVFDKVLLVPYNVAPVRVSTAPTIQPVMPWTLTGMMQQAAKVRMPWE